jgi:hypothetical protein
MKRSILSLMMVGLGVGAHAGRAEASPANACIDAIRGAQELETAGRLSAARARLSECTTGGCPGRLLQECTARMVQIDAAMPSVTVVVKDGDNRDLRDVRVIMDGKPLVDRLDGSAIPVDPGEHHLLLRAVGFRQIETAFEAHAGQHKLRVLVFLTNRDNSTAASRKDEPSLALPGAPGQPAPAWFSNRDETGAQVPSWRKEVSGVLVGAAAGSLALGTVWAFLAKAEYDHALATECGGNPNSCSPQGIADGRTAHDRALVATIGFVGAAVLLTGAATVYFAWPTKQDRLAVAPTVSSSGAGLTLSW